MTKEKIKAYAKELQNSNKKNPPIMQCLFLNDECIIGTGDLKKHYDQIEMLKKIDIFKKNDKIFEAGCNIGSNLFFILSHFKDLDLSCFGCDIKREVIFLAKEIKKYYNISDDKLIFQTMDLNRFRDWSKYDILLISAMFDEIKGFKNMMKYLNEQNFTGKIIAILPYYINNREKTEEDKNADKLCIDYAIKNYNCRQLTDRMFIIDKSAKYDT